MSTISVGGPAITQRQSSMVWRVVLLVVVTAGIIAGAFVLGRATAPSERRGLSFVAPAAGPASSPSVADSCHVGRAC